jgi:serine/threonine protein kinase
MPLSPVDKFGPYQILALLGAGGMGEVYKACHTRLGGEVAIKVWKDAYTERFTEFKSLRDECAQ